MFPLHYKDGLTGTGDRRNLFFWPALLALMVIRYTYYGIRYFPVLDDYNMYGCFSRMDPSAVLEKCKMYNNRPVSALLDAFVFSRFWNNMWIPLLLTIFIHFLTCCFIWLVFKKNNARIGPLPVILFALSPFATDAAYWLAASSRIIYGLFFMSASMLVFMKYLESRNPGRSVFLLASFALLNLVSLGFYEQVTVISFFFTMLLLLINRKRLKNKFAIILPVIDLLIFAAFYIHFSAVRSQGSRGELLSGNIASHTYHLVKAYFKSFAENQLQMYSNGLSKGMSLIAGDGSWLLFGIVLIAAGMLVLSAKFGTGDSRNAKTGIAKFFLKVMLGLLLMVVPIGPFFILNSYWITNRNTYLSIFGLGIVLEALFELIRSERIRQAITMIASFGLIVIFMVGNFSEMEDYKNVWTIDNKIVGNFSETVGTMEYGTETKGTLIFNTKTRYVEVTSPHFSDCTAADWTFMGAFYAVRPDVSAGYIYPVPNGGNMPVAKEDYDKYLFTGINDSLETFPLTGEWNGNELILYRPDGVKFGTISEEKGQYKFKAENNQG